jgi:hypothetical protein
MHGRPMLLLSTVLEVALASCAPPMTEVCAPRQGAFKICKLYTQKYRSCRCLISYCAYLLLLLLSLADLTDLGADQATSLNSMLAGGGWWEKLTANMPVRAVVSPLTR